MKAFIIIVALGAIAGMVYFFTKSSADAKRTDTKSTTTSNSGISGILAGLNTNGLASIASLF